jgi:restriction endonuclease S subunit
MLSNSKTKYSERSLGKLGLIRTGHHFREKIEPCPSGNVRVVQTKDFITGGGVDVASLTPVALEDFKEELVLQDGDIIVRSRGGSNFPAAVIHELPFVALPAFPILLIRVQEKDVLPDYVAWRLNQGKTQNALQAEAMGSFIPTVSKTALASLSIPIPPLQIQKDIVTLHQLVEEEQRLLQEISTKRQALTNRLLLQYAAEGRLPERAACLLKNPDSAATPSGFRLL